MKDVFAVICRQQMQTGSVGGKKRLINKFINTKTRDIISVNENVLSVSVISLAVVNCKHLYHNAETLTLSPAEVDCLRKVKSWCCKTVWFSKSNCNGHVFV